MISLASRLSVVVGGGSVAARRVPQLLRLGAQVVVVAPQVHALLRQAAAAGKIRHIQREFRAGDTAGSFLTLAATGIPEVNRRVAREVLQRNGLVAVAHDPSLGNCSFMAATARGPLIVAFQTGGASPLVSAALRARVESILPESLEATLDIIASTRQEMKSRVPDAGERGRRWKAAAESGLLDRLLFNGEDGAVLELRRALGVDS